MSQENNSKFSKMKPRSLGVALLSAMALSGESVNAYWGWGWCPVGKKYGGMTNFDVEKYMGNWYIIKKDKDGQYDGDSDCITATYEYKPDWWRFWPVNVLNRSYKKEEDRVTDPLLWGLFNISWARCDDEGNCKVKFLWWPEGNYQVLDTDYDNYALIYGCDTWFGLYWTTNSWLNSRTPTLPQSTVDHAVSLLKEKVGDEYFPVD